MPQTDGADCDEEGDASHAPGLMGSAAPSQDGGSQQGTSFCSMPANQSSVVPLPSFCTIQPGVSECSAQSRGGIASQNNFDSLQPGASECIVLQSRTAVAAPQNGDVMQPEASVDGMLRSRDAGVLWQDGGAMDVQACRSSEVVSSSSGMMMMEIDTNSHRPESVPTSVMSETKSDCQVTTSPLQISRPKPLSVPLHTDSPLQTDGLQGMKSGSGSPHLDSPAALSSPAPGGTPLGIVVLKPSGSDIYFHEEGSPESERELRKRGSAEVKELPKEKKNKDERRKRTVAMEDNRHTKRTKEMLSASCIEGVLCVSSDGQSVL